MPEAIHHTFDCVVRIRRVPVCNFSIRRGSLSVNSGAMCNVLQVIDPPFITREVWEKYAQVRRQSHCERSVTMPPAVRRICLGPELTRPPGLPV